MPSRMACSRSPRCGPCAGPLRARARRPGSSRRGSGGRREDEGQVLGAQAGGLVHLGDHGLRRAAGRFEDEGRGGGGVAVAEFAVQLLDGGDGAAGAGAEGEEARPAGLVGEAPAGILAAEAGPAPDRPMHGHGVGQEATGPVGAMVTVPSRRGRSGDTPAGLDGAAGGRSGIHHARAAGRLRHGEPQGHRIRDEALDKGALSALMLGGGGCRSYSGFLVLRVLVQGRLQPLHPRHEGGVSRPAVDARRDDGAERRVPPHR